MKTIQLLEDDLRIIRVVVVPALEEIPGRSQYTEEEDEALWVLIDKLKGASDE